MIRKIITPACLLGIVLGTVLSMPPPAHADARTDMRAGREAQKQERHAEAIPHFTSALADPELTTELRALIHLLRGMSYRRTKKDGEALHDLNQAIRLDPQLAYAHRERSHLLQKKEDYDGALSDINKVIKLAPGDPRDLEQRGRIFRVQGNHERAVQDFTAVIALKPKHAMAYSLRGGAYRAQGDYPRALADHTASIRLNPNDALSYNDRAVTYLFAGQRDRALSDVRIAIRLDPDAAQPHRVMSMIRHLEENLPEALAALERVPAKNQSLRDALWRYFLRARTGRTDAKEQLEKELSRHDVKPWPGTAASLFLNRSSPESVVQATAHRHPWTQRLYRCEADFLVAQYWLVQRQPDKARQQFTAALAGCPTFLREHLLSRRELSQLTP